MTNPTVTPLVEAWHDGGFLVSKGHGEISFDKVTISGSAPVLAGTVLGQQTLGAETTTHPSNTGTGVMGAVTLSGAEKVGAYSVRVTHAFTGAGDFEVIDPNGTVIGVGSVAVAFNEGGIAFTLAAGGTDFAVGDNFTFTVAAGTGYYVPYNPAATDGSQTAAAILYGHVDATNGNVSGAIISRLAEVNSSELVWGSGVTTTPQQTAALLSLAKSFIIGR